MNPWLGIFAVLAFLGALIGALVFFRGRLGPELSRKAVHVGMGLVCLSFPWIFRESWPVIVLAALAIIGLATVRVIPFLRKDVGAVLGGVERESLGEFYFPLAVAAVFLLAGGDALLYMIPILTLAVADSVGALVGVRYGFARYRTDEGLKSAEGSVAFFIAAFLSCHVPLILFSQTGRAETLLIGLTTGFVVMLLEAISWRGQDNLIIPWNVLPSQALSSFAGPSAADTLSRSPRLGRTGRHLAKTYDIERQRRSRWRPVWLCSLGFWRLVLAIPSNSPIPRLRLASVLSGGGSSHPKSACGDPRYGWRLPLAAFGPSSRSE
jgi:dolichol kinase